MLLSEFTRDDSTMENQIGWLKISIAQLISLLYLIPMSTPHLEFKLINRAQWRCDFVLRNIVLGKMRSSKIH